MDNTSRLVARRRRAHSVPRQRRIVVRFSVDEYAVIAGRAQAADAAVAAWVAEQAIAGDRSQLPETVRLLLELHTEVVGVAAHAPTPERARIGDLLTRLDDLITALSVNP